MKRINPFKKKEAADVKAKQKLAKTKSMAYLTIGRQSELVLPLSDFLSSAAEHESFTKSARGRWGVPQPVRVLNLTKRRRRSDCGCRWSTQAWSRSHRRSSVCCSTLCGSPSLLRDSHKTWTHWPNSFPNCSRVSSNLMDPVTKLSFS